MLYMQWGYMCIPLFIKDTEKGNKMNKKEWKDMYVKRLQQYRYTKKQALETYNAIDEIDYKIHPEICADDEYSYAIQDS